MEHGLLYVRALGEAMKGFLIALNVIWYLLVPTEIFPREEGMSCAVPQVSTYRATLTFYCSCAVCTGRSSPERGGHGLTRSGVLPQEGVTVAADPRIFPLGSEVEIEGLGRRVVHDTGSAIKGLRLDVYVRSHDEALKRGVQIRMVYAR